MDSPADSGMSEAGRSGAGLDSAGLDSGEAYRSLRPLMFAIAYRMLGSVTEAEDIVQEAFLRYHRALAASRPDSPKAYLSAVTTRLCIDHARSARVRRESYVGQWLPEPLLTGAERGGPGPGSPAPGDAGRLADPADLAERADSLSMAFLLVLERLSPVERAVFLLHDVFSYGYDETAQIVGRTPVNCRQLARRAREHLSEQRPHQESSPAQRAELARRFFAAVGGGDLAGLVELLAADVTVYGDSGGLQPSWPRPITGREHVGRLLISLARHARALRTQIRPAEVNGQPGALYLDPDGRLVCVLTLDIADGRVHAVRTIISPAKLRHLGPLGDFGALLRQLRRPADPPAEPPAESPAGPPAGPPVP
jgi:RNA polymerase sigma-70 factor, ECF subfamily